MGSVHSKEASVLKAPYVTAKHGLVGLCKVVAKEGAKHGVRANVICPGFVRTPLVEKQIPEQAKELGISEEDVVKTVMLKETVDGEFTTVDDVARWPSFSPLPSNALTGTVDCRKPWLVHAIAARHHCASCIASSDKTCIRIASDLPSVSQLCRVAAQRFHRLPRG